ncbi:hypothetical protein [Microbacterium cremeum]|uniref:hypothetical protein n=1 Tax=Microbacterium cremeum TaxID=2782169 RepID=UPI0018899AFA|nr:hypothetical protein [Microbacterium cremeum]
MSAPHPTTAYPFDARPLAEPLAPGAARGFVDELRRAGRLPAGLSGPGVFTVAFAVVFAVAAGSMLLVMATTVIGAFVSISEGSGLVGALLMLVPFIVVGALVSLAIVAFFRGRRAREERLYRLDRFARANAMSYLPQFDSPGLPGMIFSLGSSRQATDLVRGERPRFVEFANYRYVTGSGKNRTTHTWGYVAVKLDVPLPHIVLDATGNNGLFGSNLPQAFHKDQRLSLEGDFDRFFSLYCPAGYERDALYLFTPDIMARFIDNAAALDVEIVDDWLFLYAKRDFSTLDPATWAWLFSVVGALLDKFAQWARWRDERLRAGDSIPDASAPPLESARAGAGASAAGAASVPFAPPLGALRPPPGVAPQGRRLQRRVPWVPIVVGGVMVLWWILSNSGLLAVWFAD